MIKTPRWTRALSLSALLICGFTPTVQAADKPDCTIVVAYPVPVAVRTGGDDGLTQRLADAVRSAYGGCGTGFALVGAHESGVVTVTVEQVVACKQVGPRIRFQYLVAFKDRGGPRGHASGACWDDRLSECARQIVKATPAVNME